MSSDKLDESKIREAVICQFEGCELAATHESFLPGGWAPECDIHARETKAANERADCFKQCLIGNRNKMLWW
jgi:hypothetical protein